MSQILMPSSAPSSEPERSYWPWAPRQIRTRPHSAWDPLPSTYGAVRSQNAE